MTAIFRRLRAALLTACLAMVAASSAHALDPARSLGQARYSSWSVDAETLPPITAMAQTPDGYLWLGTQYGLYRFDGISFEHIPSEATGRHSDLISMVVATRDGDLWAAYNAGGVDVFHDGHLRPTAPGAPTGSIQNMVQAPNGDIWVETTGSTGTRFRRFGSRGWNPPAQDVVFATPGVGDLVAARDGTIWATVGPALIALRPGARTPTLVDSTLRTMASVARAPDGAIWIADLTGLRRIVDADGAHPALSPVLVRLPRPAPDQDIMIDRHGTLWDASPQLGIVRITALPADARRGGAARLEAYSPRNVSRFSPTSLLEDREGDLWAATTLGLSRFRPSNVVREPRFDDPALPALPGVKGRFRVMADGSGAIFARNSTELWAYGPSGTARRIAALPPGNDVCPSVGRGLWIPDGHGRIALVDGASVRSLALPVPKPVDICAEDRRGRLLVGFLENGLWRHQNGIWQKILLPPAPSFLEPYVITPNMSGGVFTYLGRGWVSRIDGDRAQTIWRKPSDSVGFVNTITATPGATFFGTETGLARYDGRSLRFLPARRFSFLHDISGIARTARGETWLLAAAGIVRLDTAGLDRAFQGGAVALHPQLFRAEDGLTGTGDTFGYPNAVAAADGRIWFTTNDGVFWIDPAHLHRNPQPPPVFLRQIHAGNRSYAATNDIALPEGTSRLQIGYTAVSLSMPERVRFRYRLSGIDTGWIDAGGNRQAVYTNLGPGDYRFHVVAANEDGVWNRTGAAITIHIPPTFLQSRAFLVLCIFGAIASVALSYTLRMRHILRGLNATMRERMMERERIARDLHDTLLQGVQGLLMRFQSLAYEFPRESAFRKRIDDTLIQATNVIAEGRDQIHDLRREDARGSIADDIAEAARDVFGLGAITTAVTIEGTERPLAAAACEEIRRIAWEAMFNAARHAHATRVEVLLVFTRRAFSVSIRDNGIGLDSEVARCGSPDGHYGLTGMRERAQRLKARFEIESARDDGTTITVRVPGSIAYQK